MDSSEHGLAEDPGGVGLHAGEDMLVDGHGECGAALAEALADHLYGDAGLQQDRGVGVAQGLCCVAVTAERPRSCRDVSHRDVSGVCVQRLSVPAGGDRRGRALVPATVDSVLLLMRRDIESGLDRARCDEPVTELEFLRVERDIQYGLQACLGAVGRLVEWSGAHTIQRIHPIQRLFRDAHGGSKRARRGLETYGAKLVSEKDVNAVGYVA